MRNSSLVEWFCAENSTGLNGIPKLGLVVVREWRIENSRGDDAMVQNYEELQVYQRGYKGAVLMYQLARDLPAEEVYGLTSQIKRAATSIPMNIAEGYGKGANGAELKRFLMMARGSASEMKVLLSLCRDLGYMASELVSQYIESYDEIGKMLTGLIKSIKNNP